MKKGYFVLLFILLSAVFTSLRAAAPTIAAPDPDPNYDNERWKVFSMYGYYGQDAGTLAYTYWGGPVNVSSFPAGGNECLKIQKTETPPSWADVIFRKADDSLIDLTGYTRLYLHVWDEDNNGTLQIRLIYNVYDEAEEKYKDEPIELYNDNPDKSQWVEIGLDLPDNIDLSKIKGVEIVPQYNDNKPYYIDNIYFTRPTDPVDFPFTGLIPPQRSSNNYLSLYNDIPYGNNPSNFNAIYGSKIDEYQIVTGQHILKATYTDGQGAIGITLPAIENLNSYIYVHFDIWPVKALPAGQLAIDLYKDGGSWQNSSRFSIGSAPAQEWTGFDIKLADFPRPENFTNFKTLRFETDGSTTGTNIYYFDNVYFYFAVDIPAPIPTHTNVTSVFSDTYGSLAGTWNGTSDGSVDGNTYKRVNSLSAGASINLNSTVSVSDKNLLHLDIFAEDERTTTLQLMLTDGVGTNSNIVTIASTQIQSDEWNRVNILLSDFGNIDFSTFKTLTLLGSDHALYVDNIYFYSESPVTTESPAPDHADSENVLKVYSDYFSKAIPNPGTGFSGKGTIEKQFASTTNNYLLLPGMSEYTNIDLSAAGISSAIWQFLHLDVRATSGTSNLDIRIEGTKLDGTTGATFITEEIDANDGWEKINLSTSSTNIPQGSKLNSVKISSRNGFLFLDNVYFYTSPSSMQGNVVKVEGANEENDGDINKLYPSLFDAFNAVSIYDQTTANIQLTIHENSTEDRKIQIEDSKWASLTITPAANCTITFTPLASAGQTHLLDFFNTKNVTIDGELNGARALTFVGFYNVDAGWGNYEDNSTIFFSESVNGLNDNFVIKNCIFTNNAGNRALSAIAGSGIQNITIESNEFKNCLSLKMESQETVSAIIHLRDLEDSNYIQPAGEWIIKDNYFFETDNIAFEAAYSRYFIRLSPYYNPDLSVKITNNKIGGTGIDETGNITGYLTYSGVSSHLIGIGYENVYGSFIPGNAVINNNVIANFNCTNETTFFKYHDEEQYVEGNHLASFKAISTRNGNVEVSGNTIENITWRAKEFDADTYYYGVIGVLLLTDNTVNQQNIICKKNRINNISLRMTTDGDHKMLVGYDGIKLYTKSQTTVDISENRIIWNLTDTYIYSEIAEVNAIFVQETSGNSAINVYDNICVMSGFNTGGGTLYNASLYGSIIEYANNTQSTAVYNVYNNIAYMQGNNFGGVGGRLSGIRNAYSNAGSADRINIYHNTVFINSIGNNQATSNITYQIDGQGEMHSWNNNIVNMNTNGSLLALNDFGYSGPKAPVKFDYNNYYIPAGGSFTAGYSDVNGSVQVPTFDEWKFKNRIQLFDKTTQQDYHSSFVNPRFNDSDNNTVNIDFTYDGIELLKELLQPGAFVAGHELSSLPGTDKDINQISRRTDLPTAGAVETELPNTWEGGDATNPTDWATLANWTKNELPVVGGDVIFHPNPKANLVLDVNREIRNVYNASSYDMIVNGHELTISGLVRMDSSGKLDASKSTNEASKIIYKPGINPGAVVQHLYENTYVTDEISNLTLTNEADYFVLLHHKLNITGELAVPESNNKGTGALNCYRFNTELKLSGTNDQEIPQYTIYNDTLYDLVIDGVKVVDNQDNIYAKNNLTINSGKVFDITANKSVKVNGTTTNSNGVKGLIIRSVKDTPNAAFIFNQANPTSVLATVEMYSKSSMEDDPNGDYVWQYVGIPTTGAQAGYAFAGSYARAWNPKGNDEDPDNFYWQALVNESPLTPFTGYEISNPKAKTLVYQGELVKQNKTINMPYYTSAVGYHGQYIQSNSYTASILIDSLQFGSDMLKTVYIYTTGSYEQWVSGGSGLNNDGNAPGRYLAIPQNQAGIGGLSGEIPSMQGFLVKANSTGSDANRYLTIRYPNVAARNNTAQRSVRQNKSIIAIEDDKEKEKVYTIIDLEMENNVGEMQADRMWLFTEKDCTRGFDNGWDGPKVFGGSTIPQIYSAEKEGNYQVNSVPDIDNTIIGFRPGQNGECTLRFTHKNAKEKYGNIYLLDFVTKSVTDVTEDSTEYKFTADINKAVHRFKIVTRFTDGEDNWINDGWDNSLINVFTENESLYVLNPTDLSGNMSLYDLSGRLLNKKVVAPQNMTMVSASLPHGTYIVKIKLEDNSQVVEKVILK